MGTGVYAGVSEEGKRERSRNGALFGTKNNGREAHPWVTEFLMALETDSFSRLQTATTLIMRSVR